jgi:hypothetical protein
MKELHDVKYFSLQQVKQFVQHNCNSPKAIKELLKLIMSADPQITMRASWTLQHLSFENPDRIYPHLSELIKFLRKTNQHTGAIRNVIRIFQELDLPEKYCSEIFDLCMSYSKNPAMPHAVRVFAIYTMVNICKKYPDLKYEVELIIRELKSYPQPPSFVACFKKVEKELKKIQ